MAFLQGIGTGEYGAVKKKKKFLPGPGEQGPWPEPKPKPKPAPTVDPKVLRWQQEIKPYAQELWTALEYPKPISWINLRDKAKNLTMKGFSTEAIRAELKKWIDWQREKQLMAKKPEPAPSPIEPIEPFPVEPEPYVPPEPPYEEPYTPPPISPEYPVTPYEQIVAEEEEYPSEEIPVAEAGMPSWGWLALAGAGLWFFMKKKKR